MKLSEVEKLKDAYDRVRKLDGEILSIEKLALMVSEKRTEIKMSVTVDDLDEKAKGRVRFDEDGSIMGESSPMRWSLTQMLAYASPTTPDPEASKTTTSIQFVIPDSLALRLLGELYASKDAERKEILKYFREIGVKA
jgi:hypothetical protein